jgi:hypothetical protein
MIDLVGLGVQFASGAVGGNLSASLFRSLDRGVIGNSLSGLIGGGIGCQLVNSGLGQAATVLPTAGLPDIGTILAQASASGIGGVLMALLVGVLTTRDRSH